MLSANEYRAGEIGEENSAAGASEEGNNFNFKRLSLTPFGGTPKARGRSGSNNGKPTGMARKGIRQSTFTTETLNFGKHINTGAKATKKVTPEDFLLYGQKS